MYDRDPSRHLLPAYCSMVIIGIYQIHYKTLWIHFHLCFSNSALPISFFLLTYKLLFLCTENTKQRVCLSLSKTFRKLNFCQHIYRGKTKELIPIPFSKPITSFWSEKNDVNNSKNNPVWNRIGLWIRALSFRPKLYRLFR